MQRSINDVKNWMNMFRWIVKLIRDEYQVEEVRLTRAASLEHDLGLSQQQIGHVLATIAESFNIFFPICAPCEVERLEDLCMLVELALRPLQAPRLCLCPLRSEVPQRQSLARDLSRRPKPLRPFSP